MKGLFAAALAAIAIIVMQACSTSAAPAFSERLAEADAALADGDYERAQSLANEMLGCRGRHRVGTSGVAVHEIV